MKTVSIFGSTGSVGTSTAELVADHLDQYDVKVVAANSNVQKLAEQAIALKSELAVINDETLYEELKERLQGTNIGCMAGRDAVIEAAGITVDWTMGAISGMAGLEPLARSIKNGRCVAIANKEPLVSAGSFILKLARSYEATLLPVDSEHNGVFQCFDETQRDALKKIVLTASGGPFLNTRVEDLFEVTPEQAVKHPNWSMGAKISVDSATMMNKALEIVEACYFFDVTPDMIDVLIHPQSIVHAMVEYHDGTVLSHMGAPDMKTPIAHSLSYPGRMATNGKTLDWSALNSLEFMPVNYARFPAIGLAYEALEKGDWACAALNAANEVTVDAFLNKEIGFTDIVSINANILGKMTSARLSTLEEIINYDTNVRRITREYIENISN